MTVKAGNMASRIRSAIVLGSLIVTLVLGACRDPGEGDYLDVSGKIFVFNYRIAQATYLLTLSKIRPLPDNSMLETIFENPAGGDPFVVRQKIWPTMTTVTLESPPVKCGRANREYKVSMRVINADGQVLQILERKMISDVDQSVMPDKPLVVGPFYDANPDKTAGPGACPAA